MNKVSAGVTSSISSYFCDICYSNVNIVQSDFHRKSPTHVAMLKNLTNVKDPKISSVKCDEDLVRDFGNSCNEISKFVKTHPQFRESVHSHLQNLLVDLNCSVKEDYPLEYSCEICDITIPIINNDVNYSYQIHSQSPEHLDSLENFKTVSEVKPSEISTINDSGKLTSSKWIVLPQNMVMCSVCHKALPNTPYNIEGHIAGKKHQKTFKKQQKKIFKTQHEKLIKL